MMVYVLTENGQSPLAVFEKPEKPPILPADSIEKIPIKQKAYANREVVGEWHSQSYGSIFRLVAYLVM